VKNDIVVYDIAEGLIVKSIYPSQDELLARSQVENGTQWQEAFERSFADLLPLLSLGSDIKVGIYTGQLRVVDDTIRSCGFSQDLE
jgi:hypothetical protein